MDLQLSKNIEENSDKLKTAKGKHSRKAEEDAWVRTRFMAEAGAERDQGQQVAVPEQHDKGEEGGAEERHQERHAAYFQQASEEPPLGEADPRGD